MRFHPPRDPLPSGVEWVLGRAFGPANMPLGRSDGIRAFELATALDLASRVGARADASLLAAEVGESSAVAFAFARETAIARQRKLSQLAAECCAWAAQLGIPVAVLKFAALHSLGLAQPVARPASDVDILVPASRAGEMASLLERRGFLVIPDVVPPADHQLPAMADAAGRVLEIHVSVPAVRVAGQNGFATFESLLREGALVRAASPGAEPGAALLPTRALLAAHLVAHGLAQHGLVPASYPLLRLVGDAIDLGLAEPGTVLGPAAWRFISSEVREDEYAALLRLGDRLARRDASLWAPAERESDELSLLRHFVAGALQPEYQRSLRLAYILDRPSPDSRARAVARAFSELLIPTDAQLDKLHGAPRTRWGYLGLRAARPFRLAARWARDALVNRKSAGGPS